MKRERENISAVEAPPSPPAGGVEYLFYTDLNNKNPFLNWVKALRDDKARKAIVRRAVRVKDGNFGDCRPLRDGVWELRVDVGPGYRVYYARAGSRIVILLCGGDKRSQTSDIDRAVEYWRDWQERNRSRPGQETKQP